MVVEREMNSKIVFSDNLRYFDQSLRFKYITHTIYVHENKNDNQLEKSLDVLEDLSFIENDMSYQY